MKLFIVMYWTWLGISLMILGRRLLRRLTRSTTHAPATTDRSFEATLELHPEGTALVGDLNDRDLDLDLDDRGDRGDRELDDPDASDGSNVSAVTQAATEPAPALARPASGAEANPPLTATTGTRPLADPPAWPDQPVAGRPLTGTVFAPLDLPSPTFDRARINRTYLADALQGISMPCELAPLVNVEGVDPARRAVFSTSSANADVVGSSIASELGRLGYTLEAITATEALARRGEDAVNVRISAIGPAPKKGPADPRFPTAAGNSVVLDLEIT